MSTLVLRNTGGTLILFSYLGVSKEHGDILAREYVGIILLYSVFPTNQRSVSCTTDSSSRPLLYGLRLFKIVCFPFALGAKVSKADVFIWAPKITSVWGSSVLLIQVSVLLLRRALAKVPLS